MKEKLPVILSGKVTRFKGNGRRLGYPTANLVVQADVADGVYFGITDLAEFLAQPSLIFVGVPTTVGDNDRRVEAHLLDIPDEDYYDRSMTVKLLHFHRDNQTFDSVDELVKVMKSDEAAGREWFENNRNRAGIQ